MFLYFVNWKLFLVCHWCSSVYLYCLFISTDEAELVKVVHDLCDKVILEVR